MKIRELLNEARTFKLKNEYGELNAKYKTDLKDEENENYLPQGYDYNKVIELEWVETPESDKGHGTRLMNDFLKSSFVKGAELIFLDPAPMLHAMRNKGMSKSDYIAYLASFYRKFGFETNGKNARMWKVLKGHIPNKELPG